MWKSPKLTLIKQKTEENMAMLRTGPVGESNDTMESNLHVGVYEISIRLKRGGPSERWMRALDYIRDVKETAAGHAVLRNEM